MKYCFLSNVCIMLHTLVIEVRDLIPETMFCNEERQACVHVRHAFARTIQKTSRFSEIGVY